jgi:hypothetical protein
MDLQHFATGLIIGNITGGMIGAFFGFKYKNNLAKVEYRVVIATVLIFFWMALHAGAVATGSYSVASSVDLAMGAASGFLFGDSIIEKIKK